MAGRQRSRFLSMENMKAQLSHLDEKARPRMVDVSDKTPGKREAVAEALVRFPESAWASLKESNFASAKGPILDVARVAGTMGVKRTADLIPFCHPLGLEKCTIEIRLEGSDAVIDCTCRVEHKTGVEMEALTGASVAALTIYDMCKALSHDIVIAETRLIEKTGGKRDFRRAGEGAAGE